MKLINLLLPVFIAFSVTGVAGAATTPYQSLINAVKTCPSTHVRKEVRKMSSSEWGLFNSIQQAMYRDGWYKWYGYLHNTYSKTAHGTSLFFVFHRYFLNDYEKTMRKYSANAFVPYWNSAVDFANTHLSPVLSSSYLGGNGASSTHCVTNGVAKTWIHTYPKTHCLQRTYNGPNGTIKPTYSPEFYTRILQTSTSYDQIRKNIEYSLHGAVHLSLMGDMNTMYSPLDPAFWLHHANVDRLYANWQAAYPSTRTYMFDGLNASGRNVTLVDQIPGFTNVKAYQLMALGKGEMCYRYDDKANTTVKKRGLISNLLSDVLNVPCNIIDNLFPAFANGNYNCYLDEMATDLLPTTVPQIMKNNGVKSLGLKGICNTNGFKTNIVDGKIPKPPVMNDSWLAMNRIASCDADTFLNDAHSFIDTLNSYNYKSPYVY